MIHRPRRIAVALYAADGDEFVFRAAEGCNAGPIWTGSVRAPTADAALLDIFLRVRSEIEADERILFLVDLPRKSPLWLHHKELKVVLPHCTVQGPADSDAELLATVHAGLRSDAALLLASPPDEIPLCPLTVAADGSVRGKVNGFGWLASDGQYNLHGRNDSRKVIGTKPSLVAELRAIDDAVRRLNNRYLTIICDNSFAVSMTRKWMDGDGILPLGYTTERPNGALAGLVIARERIRRNKDRLDIRWVRSHQGEPLNEGADALARLATRYVKGDSGLSSAEYRQRASGLASAFAADFRRRAAKESC